MWERPPVAMRRLRSAGLERALSESEARACVRSTSPAEGRLQTVAATSANISGVVSAASAVDISRLLAIGPCMTWNWRDIR